MSLPLPRRLAGRRVLVTRAAGQASKLSEALRALGAEPVEVPVLEIRPPVSYEAFDAALGQINRYDWLVFTSLNAVPAFHIRSMDLGISLAELRPRVAAIGKSTAQAIESLLRVRVSLTPEDYVAESLVAALKNRVAGKRVLLARAAVARDVIPDALRTAGAQVDVVEAYRNVLPEDAPEALRAALAGRIDAVTFTSSSSVTHLKEAAEKAGIAFPFAGVKAISIGPITSATLRAEGWAPAAEATPSDIPGLVEAVESVLRG
jgi:uroporphyrinogen-III synthase